MENLINLIYFTVRFVIFHSIKIIINEQINSFGVGSEIDTRLPFILLSYHPVTSEFSSTESQFEVILDEIETVGMQVIGLWPNADSGSEKISRMLRIWHKKNSKAVIV